MGRNVKMCVLECELPLEMIKWGAMRKPIKYRCGCIDEKWSVHGFVWRRLLPWNLVCYWGGTSSRVTCYALIIMLKGNLFLLDSEECLSHIELSCVCIVHSENEWIHSNCFYLLVNPWYCFHIDIDEFEINFTRNIDCKLTLIYMYCTGRWLQSDGHYAT